MCGRYQVQAPQQIAEQFHAKLARQLPLPNFNRAPATTMLGVAVHEVQLMRWVLIPSR